MMRGRETTAPGRDVRPARPDGSAGISANHGAGMSPPLPDEPAARPYQRNVQRSQRETTAPGRDVRPARPGGSAGISGNHGASMNPPLPDEPAARPYQRNVQRSLRE